MLAYGLGRIEGIGPASHKLCRGCDRRLRNMGPEAMLSYSFVSLVRIAPTWNGRRLY